MFSFNLKMHSSKEIYEYVLKNNQKIKPNKMEKIVKILASKRDAMYIYMFARNFNLTYSDIEVLTNAICKTNNYHYIYLFLKNVTFLDLSLRTKIINTFSQGTHSEAVYIYNILTDMLYTNDEEMENLIISLCHTGSPYYIYQYALTATLIDSSLSNHLVEAICSLYDPYYICLFVRNVSFLTSEQKIMLAHSICYCGKPYQICEFASSASFLPEEACDILVSSIRYEKAEDIYRLAFSLKDLGIKNKKILSKAIHMTNNYEMIKKFEQDIFYDSDFKNYDIESLYKEALMHKNDKSRSDYVKRILSSGNLKYIYLCTIYLDRDLIDVLYGTKNDFYSLVKKSNIFTDEELQNIYHELYKYRKSNQNKVLSYKK